VAKNKEFHFPESILGQIDECSQGGFLLFTFDKNGMPEVRSKFDNAQNAMAMHYYIINWLNAVEQINLENTIHNIKTATDEDGDGDGDDDENDGSPRK
jgi:hypothetical protein